MNFLHAHKKSKNPKLHSPPPPKKKEELVPTKNAPNLDKNIINKLIPKNPLNFVRTELFFSG